MVFTTIFQIKNVVNKTRWSISRILYLNFRLWLLILGWCYHQTLCVLPSFSAEPRLSKWQVSWTCSQRGLHYHLCYQRSGELLPHLFTLTYEGGLFSVALSLGSPPPEVIRLWCSVESGLSSLKGSHTTI